MIFSLSALALPPEACDALTAWTQVAANPFPPSATLSQRESWNETEWAARRRAAQMVFERYLEGRFNFAALPSCLSQVPAYRESFLNTLNTEFFDSSLTRLSRAHSTGLQKFAEAIQNRTHQTGFTFFALTGHFDSEQSPTDLPAGFQRRTGYVFMDLQRITPVDWMIIFIHESLHSLDATLESAETLYSRADIGPRLADLSDDFQDPQSLPAAQRDELDQWLIAGLNRGLWGEYRAWLLTFRLYLQGVSERLWQRSPWMDRLLFQRTAEESLEHFTYRVLDVRSSNPTSGIFSRPLIQTELNRLRERTRTRGQPLPALGNLSDFMQR